MIGLARVEAARFRSRRAIALLLLAGVLLVVVLAARTLWNTRPVTPAEQATAVAQARLAADDPGLKAEIASCRADPAAFLGNGATRPACVRRLTPTPGSMLPRGPLQISTVQHTDAIALAVLVAALSVIAGATFAGGDWASGSIRSQLVVRPARLQLWCAKALAVTLCTAVFAVVTIGGYWLALLIAAHARGIAVPGDTVGSVAAFGGRAVALAAFAGLGAYALTMLFRHTVATLALLFVYAVGSELLLGLVPLHGISRWAVGNNLRGWLLDGFTYAENTVACNPAAHCDLPRTMTHLDAACFLGGLVLVAVLVSAPAFVRRDA